MKIVLVTGGFDPIHSGHIAYFEAARKLGDKLIVGVNSDAWLTRKKGRPFLPNWERVNIINNLKMVDQVITFDDSDGSAIDAISKIKAMYPYKHQLIFANGGDRTKDNIPEMVFDDVEFVFGVGGESKLNSSSWILEEWKSPKTERPWGWYRILDDKKTYKVKELVIDPGKSLSMQRHYKRTEHWYVLKGSCRVETDYNGSVQDWLLIENQDYDIGQGVWHRGYNIEKEPCHILEIQHGEICIEEDIERR